jgi:hypothetical protein
MAIQEGVVLNGLNLNPASGNFAVEAIDFAPPAKKPEWAQSVDSDGAGLVRTPLFENRTITATVRIQPQASMNAALEKLGQLVDQLQEAEKNPGGIPLEWTPANSTKTITFYVLTGRVTSIPIMVQGEGAGWFAATPQVMIEMTAKPFGYGVTIAPEMNLVSDPSFEYDAPGSNPIATVWASYYSLPPTSKLVQAAGGIQGPQCVKIVTPGVASTEGLGCICKSINPEVGQHYRGDIYVKGNAGGEKIQFVIGAGTGGEAFATLTLTTGWQRLGATFSPTLASQVASGNLYLAVRTNGIQAVTWFMDGAQITPNATEQTYFDGDTAEYAWQGTAGNSISLPVANVLVAGEPSLELIIPGVPGDVPAEGRLVITDSVGVGRRFVEWGLENRYYNPATSLLLDSEDMVPVGGTQSTAIAAYKRAGATKNTIATTLIGVPTICANTGVRSHVGTFRVKARIEAVVGGTGSASNVHLRLAWQDGEGPLRANAWQTLGLSGALVEVDLGIVTLTPAITGSQKWLGQIEAYSTNVAAADVLHIDYLTFIPVLEGYGKATGPQSTAPSAITAYDMFTTGTLSGNLNGRTPPVGAAWVTSGSTTDWTVHSGYISRATVSDASRRFGVIGLAQGNSSLSAFGELLGVESAAELGLILRWVNNENYAFLRMYAQTYLGLGVTSVEPVIGVVVAGVTTVLDNFTGELNNNKTASETIAGATLTATLDGNLNAQGNFSVLGVLKHFSIKGTHGSLRTGGALASGKAAISDVNGLSIANTRKVFSVSVSQLSAIPYCIQPSRSMEVRSDSAITTDSTGTYYGPIPEYRGSRFFVPQAGDANRTSRVLVKADRNDLEESDQATIGDTFTVSAYVTPRFHAIPR